MIIKRLVYLFLIFTFLIYANTYKKPFQNLSYDACLREPSLSVKISKIARTAIKIKIDIVIRNYFGNYDGQQQPKNGHDERS